MRISLRRGTRLAPALRAELGLGPRDRVLSCAEARDGRPVVATTSALHRPVPGGGFVAVPWHEVLSATWDDEHGALTVDAAPLGQPRERHVLVLADPGRLPETVRERVQSSIVVSRHVPLVGKRGVRVVGRRDAVGAGGTGGVRWHVVPDPGVDVDDPALRDAVEAAVRETRAQVSG